MSRKPLALAALAATVMAVGCGGHPPPPPAASPSVITPTVSTSAAEEPTISASQSAALQEKSELQTAVTDIEHHQEKDAIPILQKIIADDSKNGEAHFWLFQAYKATDETADRSSNAYKEAHTVVTLMNSGSMGKQASDFISEVDRTHPTNVNGTYTWLKSIKVGQPVAWVGFVPKGTLLAAFDMPTGKDGLQTDQSKLQMWDTSTGKATPVPVAGSAYAVTFNAAGTRMVVACNDIEIFSLPDCKKVKTCAVFSPSIALSPDGKRLAVEDKNTVQLLDVATGKPQTTLKQEPKADDTNSVSVLAWSPDGKVLASASPAEVKLWNTNDGTVLQTLKTVNVCGLAFSHDSGLLATPDRDKGMKIWDVKTGQVVSTLQHDASGFFNDAVGFAPNGQIAGPADNVVKVWDAHSGEYQHELKEHVDKPLAAAFNTAGTMLAAGCNDDEGTVELWKVASSAPAPAASSSPAAASSASPSAEPSSSASASGSP